MSTGYGLEPQISQLRYLRDKLVRDDKLYKEAEICYQMISLYMAMDKVLTDKDYDKDYIQEKAETIFRCFRDLVIEKLT